MTVANIYFLSLYRWNTAAPQIYDIVIIVGGDSNLEILYQIDTKFPGSNLHCQ
jgi:hypothetical protein